MFYIYVVILFKVWLYRIIVQTLWCCCCFVSTVYGVVIIYRVVTLIDCSVTFFYYTELFVNYSKKDKDFFWRFEMIRDRVQSFFWMFGWQRRAAHCYGDFIGVDSIHDADIQGHHLVTISVRSNFGRFGINFNVTTPPIY